MITENNMRIYGIPEDAEGDRVQQFIENFIKTELPDTDLGIQRSHRALGPKPPQNANPQSVVVYSLEYRIKELVLDSAWEKKKSILTGIECTLTRTTLRPEIQKKRKA
ncbi:hypothetical protein NHX12_008094 [Muraenolepis orangiensis]|uniref:Uncharacterized protein n=1 Tax=Muraenolepis orangiensis TaxID=630683 RepID=A0A9Q0I9G8_9TELE|nr:hypothetical protein NHX12_008094 [Muraenolepis orangiensis]